MKQSQLPKVIINFLIPVVLLYAALTLLDYQNSGAVSIIHSGVIILLSTIIFLFKIKEQTIQKKTNSKGKILISLLFLTLFCLFSSILLTITDIFTL